jgi:zeta-carotene desaturase
MWDPIAYALGFIDCDHISARCMLTIFMLFAIRTEASVLRMLDGSPQTYLHDPIVKYLEERGVKINLRTGIRDIVYETDSSGKPCKVTGLQVQSELKEFDAVVAAVDLPGAKKLIPEPFRVYPEFDRIYELDAVPIATVQLRFDGLLSASFTPSSRARRRRVASRVIPRRAVTFHKTQAGSRNSKITKR